MVNNVTAFGKHGSRCESSPSKRLARRYNSSLLNLCVSHTRFSFLTLHILYLYRLSKSLPKTLLDNQKFALFCLGDRAYGPQFCVAGRKFATRLVQLGATPSAAVGYGDDGTPNGGVFADLDLWIDNTLLPILPKRSEAIDSTTNVTPIYMVRVVHPADDVERHFSSAMSNYEIYEDEYQTFFAKSRPLQAYRYTANALLQNEGRAPMTGNVESNDRITAESWEQNTRHICINIKGLREKSMEDSSLPYQAGDVATVFPSNLPDNVNKLLSVLPDSIQSIVDSDIVIETAPSDDALLWPRQCTLRGLLTYCADIQALPEREDLRVLAPHCDLNHPMGQDQRDKLLSLSDTSGAALYADYILREKRCWADVLYDFDSIQLSVDSLLTMLPAMRPRHFSIASAPSAKVHGLKDDEFRVELCVAVVEGTTPLGRSYHGLCSNYLAGLNPKASIRLWIQPGSFGKLPLQVNEKGRYETPILCIGSGTGIAPLRSLLLEREAVFQMICTNPAEPNGNDNKCDNILVFGCRKKSVDYYYSDDWETLVKEKRLEVLTAFSRDQWHKIYVQQVIRDADHGKLIEKHILERQGAIYVAGGAKMARAVKDEILECLTKAVGDEKQAALLLKRMHLQGRYSVEAWS